jgi:hypothetical protein
LTFTALSVAFALGGNIVSGIFTRNVGLKMLEPLIKQNCKYTFGIFFKELFTRIKDGLY